MREHECSASNEADLKRELISLSLKAPNHYFAFRASFGHVVIQEHAKQPGNNYGEDCYRTFGGFFKAGKVVRPSSSWIRQFNHVPVRD